MQRRKLMIAAGAILVFGMALAAQRTATQADRSRVSENPTRHWQPGSTIPMSEFESTERISPPY